MEKPFQTLRKHAFFILIVSFIGLTLDQTAWSISAADQQQEQKALTLLNSNKREEGLRLLEEIAQRNPSDGAAQMNYAAVLFSKANYLYKSGDQATAIKLLRETEPHFKSAISSLEKEGDASKNRLQSQCHYLLGDVYFYGYGDKATAKENYEMALKLWSGHEGAHRALQKIDGNTGLKSDGEQNNIQKNSVISEAGSANKERDALTQASVAVGPKTAPVRLDFVPLSNSPKPISLTLSNGKVVAGKILEAGSSELMVETASGIMNIHKDEVVSATTS